MRHSVENVLTLIKEYTCANQIGLAQYVFVSSRKHKELKDTLADLSSESNQILGKNAFSEDCLEEDLDLNKKLVSSVIKLEAYLYEEFYKAFLVSFKHAIKFFERRSNVLPRMCLKVIANNDLFVLFREPRFSMIKDSKVELTQNSAFDNISKGEKYFLCNDIPKGVEDNSYYNLRIHRKAVLEYNSFRKDNLDQNSLKEPYDPEWAKCWKNVVDLVGQKIPSPPETCYKSTLVIPMSLSTKDLDIEFKSHFRILESSQRAIFGFLCFDHPNIDFFDEAIDPNFSYILADTLSLYLIQQLVCTQFSSAYAAAVSMFYQDVVSE